PLGETLLTPTRIYVKSVLSLLQAVPVSGLAHITGGGFFENMPRCLGPGCGVRIEKQAVRTPPIFDLIMKEGHIPERDMFNTFNMGVGMVAVVPQACADAALRLLKASGEEAYVLGDIVEGEGVQLC
ncbi:MAG: phosphoribosylformylglycinamidine cyclo-ligase, partial [Firmicutes bacterium]|nr:phosphoribosylformylglycinamidine cyclo-ligase [Bacillota bacterium]